MNRYDNQVPHRGARMKVFFAPFEHSLDTVLPIMGSHDYGITGTPRYNAGGVDHVSTRVPRQQFVRTLNTVQHTRLQLQSHYGLS